MNGLSGIVRISNVNDFIEPSQKCILPLQNSEKFNKVVPNLVGIHSKSVVPKLEKKIKVTLSDCLACSGCITTAETMLVESQTAEQMLKGFSEHKISVVTVSPQSLCSLAVHFGESPANSAKRLTQFFKSKGVEYVLDSSFARLISRRLLYKEFSNNLRQTKSRRRTILTGICPGFVCYAEKTHGDLLIPLISRVKSPQAISGVLVKDFLRRKLGIKNYAEIFHVSVMPCYDKKLEASRKDFTVDDYGDVDCVLTASELIDLLPSNNEPQCEPFSSNALLNNENPKSWLKNFENGRILGDFNQESSGGYSDYIARCLSLDLKFSNVERTQKNKDLEEIKIFAKEFEEPLVIAKLYGFRNIQNAVQKLKRDKLQLDFVEVMACPLGCGNGGGQIRGFNTEERSQISLSVIERYSQLNFRDAESTVDEILEEWRTLNPDYESKLLTDYHSLKNDDVMKNAITSW